VRKPSAASKDFALYRLYWFYKMVESGGPDGTDLDIAVSLDAAAAAKWYEHHVRAKGGFHPEEVAK
jgi:hypothetical protein